MNACLIFTTEFQNHSFITFSTARHTHTYTYICICVCVCMYTYMYVYNKSLDVLQERKMNQQWNPIYEFLGSLVEVFSLPGCDATSWVVGSWHFEKMQSVLLTLFDPCRLDHYVVSKVWQPNTQWQGITFWKFKDL